MNVCHSLTCFSLLSLVNAEVPVHQGTVGGSITAACPFTLPGDGMKFFCTGECEVNLLETTDDRAERGRYSIEYKGGFLGRVLYVSIRQLTKRDSGQYWCGLGGFFKDSYHEFNITVTDVRTTSKPDKTSVPSASTPASPQSSTSSSGSFTLSSSLPETTEQPEQQPDRPTATASSGVLLYVRVVLFTMVVLLSLALLMFFRWRTNKPKDRPADTECASVTEPNQVYEEIREGRQRKSPPPFSSVKYIKPTETTDEYSSITAASSQCKAEDDLSQLVYSDLDFSNSGAASLHSASCGQINNVIYS